MKDVNERLNGLNLDYGFLNGLDQDEEEKALYKADMLFAKQEGRTEGAEQRSIENATNLYQLGVDDDTIIKGTGITLNQLEEIKKKIKNEK